MKSLTSNEFKQWLEQYGKASQENDAKASAELFTQNARYYESPFDDPMVGREAIYQYWIKGAQTLKDKTAGYEILAVRDNVGIARWQSTFVHIQSGKRAALDCMFLVEFDDNGQCSLFREWWHRREVRTALEEESFNHEDR